MIKKGLKNYFINLKYYFTPLGMLALGVILSFAIAIPVITGSVHDLVDYVTTLDSVQLDFSAFLHEILDAVLDLNWRNPAKAIATILDADWLNKTFADSIFALVHNVEPVAEQILEKIASCVTSIVYAFVVVLVFAVVGIIGGFFLTRFLIRKEIAKRAFWKAFLVSFVDAFITAALPILSVYLSLLWEPIVYVVTLFMPVFWSLILMLEAYVSQGLGKVKIKEVINFKTSAKLLLTNLIVLFISSVVTSLVSLVADEFLGMLLGLPFLEIAIIVGSLNAESYVKEIADLSEEAAQSEQPEQN